MGKSPHAVESIMMELYTSKNEYFVTSRLRYCPSCSQCVIASGANGAINLFDLRKLPSSPIDIYMHPENTFLGQSSTCHGLDWSVVTDGRVAAGSDDGKVCVWDALGNSQQPIVEYRAHQQAISVKTSSPLHLQSVCWHPSDASTLFSGGMDGHVYMYDCRTNTQSPVIQRDGAIHTVSAHPVERFLLATAGDENTVCLWDNRNLARPIHSLVGHSGVVTEVEWNPLNCSCLATCGRDKRVCIWDLGRIGASIATEEGPPELVFVHGGHTSFVNGIAWSPNVCVKELMKCRLLG